MIVEFYGLARAKSGVASCSLKAATAREALRHLGELYPSLGELLIRDRLSPHYLLSVNGERFIVELDEPLANETRLLLLTADAGG